MKKTLALVAAMALAIGLTGAALAADDALPHTGRVLIVTGGEVEVAVDEQADAVLVFGGEARIAGTVNTLLVIDGTATVTGATLEAIAIVQGRAELTGDTTVLGDVMQIGSTVTRGDNVQVGGAIKDMAGDLAAFGVFIGAAMLVLWIGVGVATMLVGLLIAGLAAKQVRTATKLISREPGRTALVGLLSIIVPPVLAVLAMATLVGIPTGIGLLLIIWPAVAFIGYVVAAIWIGEWLLNRRTDATVADRPYGAAVVGLLVAFVIGFVPLATAIVSIFGLGAVVLAAWRTLRRDSTPQPLLRAEPAPIG